MKTSVLYIIIISTLLTVLLSCNKESKCTGVSYSYVNEEDRKTAISPYTGIDTLMFLYNNKDTQIYVGQGVQSGWQLVPGGDPSLCDRKYEYLTYTYNCTNTIGFTFRMDCFPMGDQMDEYRTNFKFYFKNVYVGARFIDPIVNDSIKINGNWYYEPYYWANGQDTVQYVMFCNVKKKPTTGILKIKYLNNELTLIK